MLKQRIAYRRARRAVRTKKPVEKRRLTGADDGRILLCFWLKITLIVRWLSSIIRSLDLLVRYLGSANLVLLSGWQS